MSTTAVPLPRRLLLASLSALMVLPAVAAAAPKPPQILFVCQFGSVKSAVAREIFRRRAAERGIDAAVQSRGLTPASHRTATLDRQLAADGIDPDRQALQPLADGDLHAATIVVWFEKPAAATAGARDWSDTPSMLADYAAARLVIAQRIDRLLDELATPAKPAQ